MYSYIVENPASYHYPRDLWEASIFLLLIFSLISLAFDKKLLSLFFICLILPKAGCDLQHLFLNFLKIPQYKEMHDIS